MNKEEPKAEIKPANTATDYELAVESIRARLKPVREVKYSFKK